MTPFEIVVAGRMIEQGYEMYNSGWPDFCFVKRDGDEISVRFVEAKSVRDEVRPNQKQIHDIFKALGFIVEVVSEDPNQKMVPCFDEDAAPGRPVGRPANQLDRAKKWLADQLQDGFPHLSANLLQDARDGYGISNDTLRKAKDDLGARVFKEGTGAGLKWFWVIDPADDSDNQEQK